VTAPAPSFADRVLAARRSRACELPAWADTRQFLDNLLGILFPHFSSTPFHSAREIDARFELVARDLIEALLPVAHTMQVKASDVADAFLDRLPNVWDGLWLDAEAIYRGDPAAESVDEVISAYPGFLAIAIHRISHEFWRLGVPIFPRMLAEVAHQRTGIDIHPGAAIGPSFCIDHGTGVVIGETAVVGAHVKIYQGVTLGALSVDKALSGTRRHPTIGDRVVIYSHATILGGSTVVGHDSVIGGNVWLTASVPPHARLYHRNATGLRTGDAVPVASEFDI